LRRNPRKVSAVSANIPVLRRLSAETNLMSTAAHLGTQFWLNLRVSMFGIALGLPHEEGAHKSCSARCLTSNSRRWTVFDPRPKQIAD
jgi:hypothetical protein